MLQQNPFNKGWTVTLTMLVVAVRKLTWAWHSSVLACCTIIDRLHCIQNQKWPTGPGKGSTSRFLVALINYCSLGFWFQHSFLKKSRWQRNGKRGKEDNHGDSGDYVIASWLPSSDRLQCSHSCQLQNPVIFRCVSISSNLVVTQWVSQSVMRH